MFLMSKYEYAKTDMDLKYMQPGYLTVFAALSMMVMISLCLVLIEGARSNGIRLKAEIIADVGLNSVLAEFHRELLNQYNIFFIDMSYGTERPLLSNTQEHLRYYLEENLSSENNFWDELWYRDLFGMNLDQVYITNASLASDVEGAVLRRRLVEAVEDDVGLAYLKEVQEWVTEISNGGWDKEDIAGQKNKLDQNIQEYDGEERQVSEDEWVTINVRNPTSGLENIRAGGILGWVMEKDAVLSGVTADRSQLFSARMKNGEVNKGSGTAEEESFTDKLLFLEYCMRYCGYYGAVLDKGAFQYQLEYLIAGKDKDNKNLENIVFRISAIREAANAAYIFSDKEKCAEAELAAAAAASAMLLPEITPLLKTIILLGWAYAESLYDTKVLLSGGRVPLMKNKESWHYDISCIFGIGEEEGVTDFEQGLAYSDYLRVLLALSDQRLLTVRLMDIMEMDVRVTAGNSHFRIDGCADMLEAAFEFSSGYGYQFHMVRSSKY